MELLLYLAYLQCNLNDLTSLDVSNNTALTELQCRNNQLTSLDVSNNTALTYAYSLTVDNTCSQTDITSGQIIVLPISLCSVGLNDQPEIENITIYNDQNNNIMTLQFNKNYDNPVQLTILNISGQIVFDTKHKSIQKGEVIKFNLSPLSKGMYLINIISENEYKSIKFIN